MLLYNGLHFPSDVERPCLTSHWGKLHRLSNVPFGHMRRTCCCVSDRQAGDCLVASLFLSLLGICHCHGSHGSAGLGPSGSWPSNQQRMPLARQPGPRPRRFPHTRPLRHGSTPLLRASPPLPSVLLAPGPRHPCCLHSALHSPLQGLLHRPHEHGEWHDTGLDDRTFCRFSSSAAAEQPVDSHVPLGGGRRLVFPQGARSRTGT